MDSTGRFLCLASRFTAAYPLCALGPEFRPTVELLMEKELWPMTQVGVYVLREEGYGLRPDEDLLHRIVDNLVGVHSMPNDFVSVIQPTAAKTAEGTDPEAVGKRPVPVLPVRDTVLFPHAVLPLTVGRDSSIQLI